MADVTTAMSDALVLGILALVQALVILVILLAYRPRVAWRTRNPKPHRHQWQFRSEEHTNRQRILIYVCRVPECRDTMIEEAVEIQAPVMGGGE